MAAETLNCPMCGASASTDSTRCAHCGARLATISCPACFGMMFAGAKFCSHCGAKAARTERPGGASLRCPRCRTELKAVKIGSSDLRECPRCEGLWAEVTTLEQICADREKQAAVLGTASVLESKTVPAEKVRYLPCPVCGKLMNRVNFARCSQVVVDVCKGHGTWFDHDELHRIVEFIRAGGLEIARTREIAELQNQRRELAAAEANRNYDPPFPAPAYNPMLEIGVGTVASLIRSLLR